jgi:hypothetical protein
MRNCIRISIFLFLLAVLSQSGYAKTVYFNMSWSPITSPPNWIFGFGGCNLMVNDCSPYPIDFYYTYSTTVVPPPSTSAKATPSTSSTYCLLDPTGYGSPCQGSAPSTTSTISRGLAIGETGTIPAGQWTIGINTSSTANQGNAKILVYMWRVCAVNVGPGGYETYKLLFTAQGTNNVLNGGNAFTTITTNQPSFWFGTNECYLIGEYYLNVTTGSGNSNDNFSMIGGVVGSNVTYPTPINVMNSVTLNSPQTDPSLNATKTFLMNCTPNTDDSIYGINMSFEYNYTGNPNFVPIPTSGSMLVANATSPANVRNNTMYSLLINASTGNDYYVRCRLYNSTTNITTNAQKVSVRYPPNLTIAEFRLYPSGWGGNLGSGGILCDIASSFGSSIPNSNCSNPGFYEGGTYRGEIEICNDQLFGRDVNINRVVQGNLTSPLYIGFYGVACDSWDGGGGSLDGGLGIDCNWNTLVPNALYMDASGSPPLVGTKINNTRTSYSCQWYTYIFMPGPVVNNTLFTSNITTVGATIGSNPQVGRLSIMLYTVANMKIAEFRLYQSSNMTTLGSGTQVCDINSSFGNNIANNSLCTGLTSLTQYRAEVRVCQDWWQSGKNINISGVVQGNLTASYVGAIGYPPYIGCASGNGALSPINCDWNTTVPNGAYINASTSPQFTNGNRTSTSCQWFVYNFTTNSTVNSTTVSSNLSTQGVSSGINPQVSNLTISIMPQSFMSGVTLNSPSADLNLTDLSNFSMICTPSTGGGYGINLTFEYNSTSQGWGTIPSAGANLTIDGNNPNVNVSNGIPYLSWYVHTVNVSSNSFGTYWVRCRINNASTSLYSSVVKIGVYPGYLNVTINYPPPAQYNISSAFNISQYSTFPVNASVKCSSSGSKGDCGSITCSVRYNQSSLLPNSVISGIPGATPFYVVSANMTHDFTGVSSPSATHQALYEVCSWGQLQYTPPNSIFTNPASNELSTADYALLSLEDGLDSSPPKMGTQDAAGCQQFRFQINESINSISSMRVYYKGHSSANTSDCSTTSYLTRLYAWNFTSSSWSLIGSTTSNFDDVVSAVFNSSFGSIVNSSYMYLLASSDLSGQHCVRGNISTDYVKVDVGLSNQTSLPCGKTMTNQTCNFTWLINATGVNEMRLVDVNCSTAKTTVNASDSSDLYVYLKGIEIHADKSSYRNCGKVFYKVSSYAVDNTLFNQNLTVNIYDQAMNLVNQNKVQTSGGVYTGAYSLQPSASIGQWLIKAYSCGGVYNKTFGVGIGNSSAYWRMDVQMPNRVKFAAGETISFTVNLYNQLGEKSNTGVILYRDNSFWNSCSPMGGMCSVTAPSSPGTHSIGVYSPSALINETRYFYVGG